MSDTAAVDSGIRHVVWFYRTHAEYAHAVEEFVRTGLARDEPVLVALADGELPVSWRPPAGSAVTMADMRELGRNPARIIQAIHSFCDGHSGRRLRYLGEPVWPGRSPAELV